MNDSSSMTKNRVVAPVAFVDFKAVGSISDVAAALSTHLFGAIPFAGDKTGIRDEVPAVRLCSSILGLDVVLHGYGGEDGFTLEAETSMPWSLKLQEKGLDDSREVDISTYLGALVSSLDGFIVERAGLVAVANLKSS